MGGLFVCWWAPTATIAETLGDALCAALLGTASELTRFSFRHLDRKYPTELHAVQTVVRSLREDAVREQARRLVPASRFDRDVVMLRALELR